LRLNKQLLTAPFDQHLAQGPSLSLLPLDWYSSDPVSSFSLIFGLVKETVEFSGFIHDLLSPADSSSRKTTTSIFAANAQPVFTLLPSFRSPPPPRLFRF
jgi:hypothetical protein